MPNQDVATRHHTPRGVPWPSLHCSQQTVRFPEVSQAVHLTVECTHRAQVIEVLLLIPVREERELRVALSWLTVCPKAQKVDPEDHPALRDEATSPQRKHFKSGWLPDGHEGATRINWGLCCLYIHVKPQPGGPHCSASLSQPAKHGALSQYGARARVGSTTISLTWSRSLVPGLLYITARHCILTLRSEGIIRHWEGNVWSRPGGKHIHSKRRSIAHRQFWL